MKRIVNICGYKYRSIEENWTKIIDTTIQSFLDLGFDVRISRYLKFEDDTWNHLSRGIDDSPENIFVYNHSWVSDVKQQEIYRGSKTIFLKPTGPTKNHFTLDPHGYASCSSISFNKPDFEGVSSDDFFSSEVSSIIKNKQNKWSGVKSKRNLKFDGAVTDIPLNHILVVCQMEGDETVNNMSFGSHLRKVERIVNHLIDSRCRHPIVVKFPPWYNDGDSNILSSVIPYWKSKGVVVFEGRENIHDFLPFTRVAIIENSTAGIECIMHDVPIISYGAPEYRWITKDLRCLTNLNLYIDNLDWFDRNKSRSWITWYCKNYQCYDLKSTKNRIQEILDVCNYKCKRV
jgi:hypothetical protein